VSLPAPDGSGEVDDPTLGLVSGDGSYPDSQYFVLSEDGEVDDPTLGLVSGDGSYPDSQYFVLSEDGEDEDSSVVLFPDGSGESSESVDPESVSLVVV
jgi:hypothetical protein